MRFSCAKHEPSLYKACKKSGIFSRHVITLQQYTAFVLVSAWGKQPAFLSKFMQYIVTNTLYPLGTIKRPKFDILFGENIFFLQNLFRWPPLKVFGGVSKIRIYQLIKVGYSIWTRQGPQNYTFLQVSNLRLQCLTSSCERIISYLGLFIDSECVPPWNQRGDTLACRWGGRGSQFWRLERKPGTLYTLWSFYQI